MQECTSPPNALTRSGTCVRVHFLRHAALRYLRPLEEEWWAVTRSTVLLSMKGDSMTVARLLFVLKKRDGRGDFYRREGGSWGKVARRRD